MNGSAPFCGLYVLSYGEPGDSSAGIRISSLSSLHAFLLSLSSFELRSPWHNTLIGLLYEQTGDWKVTHVVSRPVGKVGDPTLVQDNSLACHRLSGGCDVRVSKCERKTMDSLRDISDDLKFYC